MISHFPHPYPDELFYSILARYHSRVGNRCHRTTLLELFGSRNVMVSADLPGHISLLVERLPQAMKYSAKELVYDHTLYPFYSPFLPQNRAEKVIQCMYSNGGRSIHYTTGLMSSRIPLAPFLRFCPECIWADRHNFGEAYWHRSHQIPLLPICWFHEIMLVDTTASAFGSKTDGFIHLDQYEALGNLNGNDIASDIVDSLKKLAADGAWLLKYPQQPKHLQYYRDRYLKELDRRGLVSRNGKHVDQEALQDIFHQMYPQRLLQFLGIPIDDKDDHNWLRDMVRKYRKAVHPLLHLLVIRLLWGSLEEFSYVGSRKSSSPQNPESFCRSTKPNLIETPQLKEKRHQWMALEGAYPEVGRTGLRNQMPALYAWLYRNDLTWLRERPIERSKQKSTVQRIDWSGRDSELFKQAQAWMAQERCRVGKPKRITVLRVSKDLGARAWIEKHPDKLPLTIFFLKRVEESVERFQIRRIFWVVQNMKDKGIQVNEWRIRRMAGLRPELEPDVEEALRNVLDDAIAGGIVQSCNSRIGLLAVTKPQFFTG